MKKQFLVFGLATLLLGLYSCGKEKSTNEPNKVEKVADAQIFSLNKEQSNIDWKGYKIFKSKSTNHFGTIHFSEGEIGVKEGKIVSGKFIIDINTIQTKDIENADLAKKLDSHLKNSDFFDVAKYPTATFEITKVTATEQGDYNSILEGNLTMKDITKSVHFNTNIKVDDQQVSIFTEPTDIDRTEFNVKFQSPAKDGFIKNEMTLQISIKADIKK